MQIDAVQQRARHPRAVAIDPFVAAQAAVAAVTGPAARAGIHRGHQLEPRGVLHAACRAGDADVAGLQWLAQGFQCAAVPLWKLVRKRTPWWASDISPGQGGLPPPTSAAALAL